MLASGLVLYDGESNLLVGVSGGFGHPLCGFGEEVAVSDLPNIHPIGLNFTGRVKLVS